MQQKVNMTWIGLSSTEWRGLTDNDMLWRGSAGRDAGLGRTECEEAKVAGPACRSLWEGPSPRLNWERGRGCAGLRLHHISASLRTEAQGTRKSSEAARGVFSRIMKKFFFFFPSSFWKFCTFKLKCEVHLRQWTDIRTCVHMHIFAACAQPSCP